MMYRGILLILLFFSTLVMANTKGEMGDLQWSFDPATSTLTFSGQGLMDRCSNILQIENDLFCKWPWSEYKDSIKHIVLQEGVTSIETWAFQNCSNLVSVSIPNTVTQIGHRAFADCKNLLSFASTICLPPITSDKVCFAISTDSLSPFNSN